ncbi:hypothetical protein [Arthrobacter sp. SX1312]|uniref:hypothetical protein n=1 Tax=Arthrobacter sp. SX1312 TaxID=2058896 RepID=UPI0011AFF0A4|nr:hypothetical protein [Arthrobacter sp. SX1312]
MLSPTEHGGALVRSTTGHGGAEPMNLFAQLLDEFSTPGARWKGRHQIDQILHRVSMHRSGRDSATPRSTTRIGGFR